MLEIELELAFDSQSPLAGAGCTAIKGHPEREPFEALDDLMSVIEALCPVWPPRGVFAYPTFLL